MIDDFVLPLCERSGDVANRNIVVILSGSTYGYIEMMASLCNASIPNIDTFPTIKLKRINNVPALLIFPLNVFRPQSY